MTSKHKSGACKLSAIAPFFVAIAPMLAFLASAMPAAAQQQPNDTTAPAAPAQSDAAKPAQQAPAPGEREAPASPAEIRQAEGRPALGVLIEPIRNSAGVRIAEVTPGSPAEKAGLRPGDRIVLVDGEQISSSESLLKSIRDKKQGADIQLRVIRNGQQMDVKATLATRAKVFDRPADTAREFRSGYRGEPGEKTGVDKRAWLGVILEENRNAQASQPQPAAPQPGAPEQPGAPAQPGAAAPAGARISAIFPGGPASRSGLREGDVIVRAGDQAIGSPKELAEFIENGEPDKEIQFTVLRSGREMQLPVHLGARMLFAEPQVSTFGADGAPQDNPDRNPKPGQPGQYTRDDLLDSLPESAVMAEQNRQLCIQNERLEKLVLQVLQDVQALREEVAALKGGGQPAAKPANGNTATPPAAANGGSNPAPPAPGAAPAGNAANASPESNRPTE